MFPLSWGCIQALFNRDISIMPGCNATTAADVHPEKKKTMQPGLIQDKLMGNPRFPLAAAKTESKGRGQLGLVSPVHCTHLR